MLCRIAAICSSVLRCASLRRRDRFLLLLEAGAAEDGAALSGPEGHGRFRSALRAGCSRLRAHAQRPARTLGLALLAVLRVVFELLVMKEHLLAGSEDELGAAVHAFQHSIGEFHVWPASPKQGPAPKPAQIVDQPVRFPVFVGVSLWARTAPKSGTRYSSSHRRGKINIKRGELYE